MIVYIILILMGIFTVWNVMYTHNVKKYNNKMMNNIEKYEKKKVKQQKSKV